MKRRSLLFIYSVSVLFFSCIKSNNIVDDGDIIGGGGSGGGGGAAGPLVIRSVGKTSATDSLVTLYGYDGSSRFNSMSIKGSAFGSPVDTKQLFNRDGAGKITQIQQISYNSFFGSYDTTITSLFYDAGTGKYSYAMTDLLLYRDSSVFTYDASGRIISTEMFYDLFGSFEPLQKVEYTYNSAGTVLSVKNFDYNGATYDLSTIENYTYDSKTNPLKLSSVDAVLTSLLAQAGPSNVVLDELTDLNTPANNRTTTITYTSYTSDNRPLKGTTVVNPGASTQQVTIFYN